MRATALTVSLAFAVAFAVAGAPPGTVVAQDDDGRRVFTSAAPPCATCHTLAAAGASGKIGPNLDALDPTEARVRRAVRSGVGAMPAYEDTLSDSEIDAVSRYVASVAGTEG